MDFYPQDSQELLTENFAEELRQVFNTKGGYAIIPDALFEDKEVPCSCKLFFGAICKLLHARGYCFANNRYFNERYGHSPATIKRYLEILEQKKWIKRIYIRKPNSGFIIERRIFVNMTKKASFDNKPKNVYEQDDAFPVGEFSTPPFTIDDDVLQPTSKEALMEMFQDDIWSNPQTPNDCRNCSKQKAFARWAKATNSGKKREIVRDGWFRYVAYQKHCNYPVKKVEFFLTPDSRLWECDWAISETTTPVQHSSHNEPRASFEDDRPPKVWAKSLYNLGRIDKTVYEDCRFTNEWRYATKDLKIACRKAFDEGYAYRNVSGNYLLLKEQECQQMQQNQKDYNAKDYQEDIDVVKKSLQYLRQNRFTPDEFEQQVAQMCRMHNMDTQSVYSEIGTTNEEVERLRSNFNQATYELYEEFMKRKIDQRKQEIEAAGGNWNRAFFTEIGKIYDAFSQEEFDAFCKSKSSA